MKRVILIAILAAAVAAGAMTRAQAQSVLPRIVMSFTPKGETHNGLLPASATHGS